VTHQVGAAIEASVQFAGEEGRFSAYGAAPAHGLDTFQWSFGRLMRNSATRTMPNLPLIWQRAIVELAPKPTSELRDGSIHSSWTWGDANGDQHSTSYASLIGKALKDLAGQKAVDVRVLAVDNAMSDAGLDVLINSLRTAGHPTIELLWRPVAILLGLVRQNQLSFDADDPQALVLDFGAASMEVTPLEIRERDSMLVPLRRAYREDESGIVSGGCKFSKLSWRRLVGRLAGDVAQDAGMTNQLLSGPFSGSFIEWVFSGKGESTWAFKGDHLVSIDLDSDLRREAFARLLKSEEWLAMLDVVNSFTPEHQNRPILHGWPEDLRAMINNDFDVTAPCTACYGCQEYIERLAKGEPTYLEEIPQVQIVSKIEETGATDFIEIIKADEYLGGHTIPVKPITRFAVQKGMTSFPIMISRSDWDGMGRKMDVAIPRVEENTPVIINAELKPGQGHVKLWIEGAAGHKDVFGEQRRIYLDWDRMEEFELIPYKGPEYYPVRGRIFDEDDPDIRLAVRQMVERVKNVEGRVNYKGHEVAFSKILNPWGATTPWGAQLGEPTRGIFGSQFIDDEEVRDLSRRLTDLIGMTANCTGRMNNRHKYLNYMFVYTSDGFLDELRGMFSQIPPDISNWNVAYAPGRVFASAADFEILLDFMIRVSGKAGWPSTPDESYTTKYFWSVFRCLCYHKDTVNVPVGKIESVLEQIARYVEFRNEHAWSAATGEIGQNPKKFCLFAILFSCRLREHHRGFLPPACVLNMKLVQAIKAESIGTIRFPQTMMGEVPDGTLNDYVTRFLLNEAGDADIALLSGLVTSMA